MSLDSNPTVQPVDHDPFAGAELAAFVPITESQREVWIASELSPQLSLGYNEGLDITLKGPLDVAALQQSLQTVIDRHEALRSSFSPDGEHVMIRAALPLPFALIDLTLPERAYDSLAAVEHAEMGRAFDLVEGPLLRFTLVRLSEQQHHLLFIAHHLVCDGWSGAVVLTELAALYSAQVEGKPLSLPAPPRYGDYALIEREFHRSETGRQHEAYWLQTLKAAPTPPSPPPDRPRPAERSFKAGRIDLPLDPALVGQLRALGKAEGSSLVATTMAAFASLLQRLTGQSDLVIGLAAAGQSFHEQKMLVGHCVNLLPLRFRLQADEPFTSALRHARGVILDAIEHQGVTFGQLLPKLDLVRSAAEQPLVAVAFNIDVRDDDIRHAGLEVSYRTLARQGETFDLFVNLVDNNRDLLLEASYNADLYSPAQMQAFLSSFETLLQSVASAPQTAVAALPLLQPADRARLLAAPALATPQTRLLHEWFAETAARHGDRIAVTDSTQRLSYRELDARSNQLAHALVAKGIAPERLVAVLLERSALLPLAVLGVLKAGGAYLPIDPATPPDRLIHMLRDAGAALVITDAGLLEKATAAANAAGIAPFDLSAAPGWAHEPDTPPAVHVSVENLAYVIYTSGSTGTPKGCMLTQANVSRLFTSTAPWFGFNEQDVWTLFHSIAFDFSVWELFGALLYGGRLVVVTQDVARDPAAFFKLLADEQVTVLNQTPSAFRQLIAVDAGQPLALRRVVFGGEALEFQNLAPWFERRGDGRGGRGPTLVNMYGITETTVHVTYRVVAREDLAGDAPPSLIGVPIPDLGLYVLDSSLQPLPPGVTGEMWVGGAGVARGYLNRPELTAERFIDDPHHPGQRLYKTGDLARWRADGELEYLGRIDQQVKLRGYRIELGEIQAQLARHADVAEVFVNIVERSPGDPRLVAWVVARGETPPTASALRAHLRGSLPDYMLPQHVVAVERFPLTTNGKLDHKRLPSPFAQESAPQAKVAPRTLAEKALAAIWAEVLGINDIGIEDRFAELGGHSLLAVQIAARIQTEFGSRPALRSLLMDPLAVVAAQLSADDLPAAMEQRPAADAAGKPPPQRAQPGLAATHAADIRLPVRPKSGKQKSWLGRLFG